MNAAIRLSALVVACVEFFLCSAQAQFLFETNSGTITIGGYSGPGGAVSIPDTINGLPVTTIGWYAFEVCTNVTSVTIPISVTSILDSFQFCPNLTNVIIGKSVPYISPNTFLGCTNLTAITVDVLNPVYSDVDGVLFNNTQTTLIHCPPGKVGNYTIPNTVTRIGTNAFYGCTRLTGITIPNSVTSIEDGYSYRWEAVGAFFGCTGLANVTIPDSITHIGAWAFAECSSLTNVIIGNSVTTIGDSAFRDCTSLASVSIPNSVTNLGFSAFAGCAGLAKVIIGNSVTNLGFSAFAGCTSLTNVIIGNNVTTIGDSAFAGCTSLTNVVIPASVTSIGSVAFLGCTNLVAAYFEGNSPTPNDTSAFIYDNDSIVYYRPGTTGWGSTFEGRPTALWALPSPIILASAPDFGIQTNRFGFFLSGPANLPVVVEACTDLTLGVWLPLAVQTLTNGSAYFSDPQWTSYPARFYRVRSL